MKNKINLCRAPMAPRTGSHRKQCLLGAVWAGCTQEVLFCFSPWWFVWDSWRLWELWSHGLYGSFSSFSLCHGEKCHFGASPSWHFHIKLDFRLGQAANKIWLRFGKYSSFFFHGFWNQALAMLSCLFVFVIEALSCENTFQLEYVELVWRKRSNASYSHTVWQWW